LKKLILFFSLFNFTICNSQISKELESFIKPFDSVKTYNIMDGENYSILKKLNKKATENELVFLSLNGKNTYIKAISIETLLNRKSEKIFDIYESLIDSKDSIIYVSGSLTDSESLHDFVLDNLIFYRFFSEKEVENNKEVLVRKILNKNPLNIKLLEKINNWIPQNEEFYNPIRKIVIENKSSSLLEKIQ
jgi:hypothetical protein